MIIGDAVVQYYAMLNMVLSIHWNKHIRNSELCQNSQIRSESEGCFSQVTAIGVGISQCLSWYTGYHNMECENQGSLHSRALTF